MTLYLDCPCCGEPAFERQKGLWTNGEEETHACGAKLMIGIEDTGGDEDEAYPMWMNEDEMDADGGT